MIIGEHTVRLQWGESDDKNNIYWNQICASAIEEFGLPGTKFTWHPTEDYMDFVFKDSRDALIFQLRWA